ncbi:TIGR02679 family protein [Plantactinospora sp. S1510]|uniref:TIGR02679 family protein n=1 Tax=Plantactinospora alkalitolerans TaxID=2789879 RepID=A0ABS0H2C6_9ACTN|nr:TIGR02679 family protein [Plantactinospora alkalitolerans]MBF9132620.1 TIGR02679 family protein [Plantactinospora alkalitolerans]
MTDLGRLRRQLGGTETARLVQRLRRRLAHGRALTGTLSLDRPTPEERQAVERLLGRRPGRGGSLTVNLDDLDRVVRRSGMHSDGLVAALELLGGAVTVLADVRAAEAAAWHVALAPLEALSGRRAELFDWCVDASTVALLRRLGRVPDAAARLTADLVAVLDELPAAGVPLARLAVQTTGDAHALDSDRPLSTLVLSAVRAIWWGARQLPASAAEQRRALWDAAGVLVDELSSTMLVLNLPAVPGSRLHALTSSAVDLGEPMVLTLRQVARERPGFPATRVHVCENPTVLAAAADRLGRFCPPLVCVNGQPTTAAVRLLSALADSGCELFYHGDFDWGGVRIANLLRTRVPWRPWRYDTSAYLSAVHAGAPGSLRGTPVESEWDSGLTPAMRRHGVRVEEELVLEELIRDLSTRT